MAYVHGLTKIVLTAGCTHTPPAPFPTTLPSLSLSLPSLFNSPPSSLIYTMLHASAWRFHACCSGSATAAYPNFLLLFCTYLFSCLLNSHSAMLCCDFGCFDWSGNHSCSETGVLLALPDGYSSVFPWTTCLMPYTVVFISTHSYSSPMY